MDIFEKLAELNNETFSTLKWIFLFVSCIAFFVSLLVVKPSKKDVSKAVTFSSAVSFAVAASGFVYCDIIDMVCKLINCNAGLFTTIEIERKGTAPYQHEVCAGNDEADYSDIFCTESDVIAHEIIR